MARIEAKKTPRKRSKVAIDDSIRKLVGASFNEAVKTIEDDVKETIKFDRGEKDDIIDLISTNFAAPVLEVIHSALCHEIDTRIASDVDSDDADDDRGNRDRDDDRDDD